MLSYCLKCRKNIESKNQKCVRTKNGRMLLSKRTVGVSKKLKFVKEWMFSRLLSNKGINAL